jgi:hypothetical protein
MTAERNPAVACDPINSLGSPYRLIDAQRSLNHSLGSQSGSYGKQLPGMTLQFIRLSGLRVRHEKRLDPLLVSPMADAISD